MSKMTDERFAAYLKMLGEAIGAAMSSSGNRKDIFEAVKEYQSLEKAKWVRCDDGIWRRLGIELAAYEAAKTYPGFIVVVVEAGSYYIPDGDQRAIAASLSGFVLDGSARSTFTRVQTALLEAGHRVVVVG